MSTSERTEMRPRVSSRKTAARSQNPARPVEALKRRAAEHGRSAEAEHRIILEEALRDILGNVSDQELRHV
jgi:hypothetical protein